MSGEPPSVGTAAEPTPPQPAPAGASEKSGSKNDAGGRDKAKSPRHWVAVLAVLVLSMLAAPQIYEHFDLAKQWRVGMFQWLCSMAARRSLPSYVTVVLIDDQDYWLGEPGGRRPIRRDYLAKLVTALDTADAKVIALDFDMRLPDPDGTEIPTALRDETDSLIMAIVSAAEHRKVVLSRSIWIDGEGHYRFDQDSYQPYGLCTDLVAGHWRNPGTARIPVNATAAANISCGYIALIDDQLVLPGVVAIGAGHDKLLDSFSLAVARDNNPYLAGQLDEQPRYTTFISTRVFEDFNVLPKARDLLAVLSPAASPDVRARFAHRSVIVGADWCRSAFHRCPGVDVHATPVGIMTGALLHANYAEAVLDSRTLSVARPWLPPVLEFSYGVIAAVALSLARGMSRKMAVVVVLFVALPVVQLLTIQFVGMYFEAVIPLIGLTLHTVFDRFLA